MGNPDRPVAVGLRDTAETPDRAGADLDVFSDEPLDSSCALGKEAE